MFPVFYGKQTAKKEEEPNTVLSRYYVLLCSTLVYVRHSGCSHILRTKQAITYQQITNPGGVIYGLLLLMRTLAMNLSLTAHTWNIVCWTDTLSGA